MNAKELIESIEAAIEEIQEDKRGAEKRSVMGMNIRFHEIAPGRDSMYSIYKLWVDPRENRDTCGYPFIGVLI